MTEIDTSEDQMQRELDDLETLIPTMSVNIPVPQKKEAEESFIPDEMLLGLYGEMLDMSRQDRVETSEYLNNFADMIFNGGDGSSSSKEALVQLMKLKTDTSNNMAKIADLMTRIKLKDRYTSDFKHMSASQTNNINIRGSQKDLIKALNTKTKTKVD